MKRTIRTTFVAVAGAIAIVAAAGYSASAATGNTKWGDIELKAADGPTAHAWPAKIEIGAL